MFNKLLAMTFTMLLSLSVQAGAPGKIEALSWMTGAWAGPVGPATTLEENWIQATGGSIASLVRITTPDATPMVELIVIEQQGDSLMLYVKQWDPAFTPRSEKPQVMDLIEQGDRMVSFRNTGEGDFRTLTYTSPSPDSFIISITRASGESVDIPLQAR